MESKEEQAVKHLNVKNAVKDNEGGEIASMQNEEESHHLGGVERQKPQGNVGLGRVRRLVPNFQWAILNSRVEHHEVGDNVGRFVGQVVKIKRKTREPQMRPYMCFQTREPDNHHDFCLMP
uniref:protein BEX4 n=1 Tax=Jaculus jaculus TaxID=51337 RepID=UPI0003331100|nr:protein BEX4 [Jaculus jaculus]XP_044996727.1 protein BEX4 [Jaculus jaculus]